MTIIGKRPEIFVVPDPESITPRAILKINPTAESFLRSLGAEITDSKIILNPKSGNNSYLIANIGFTDAGKESEVDLIEVKMRNKNCIIVYRRNRDTKGIIDDRYEYEPESGLFKRIEF